MAYSFQKVYTLVAQTPMIHFQHDQSGATLRATEVKPKLDEYLLKCAKTEGVDQKTLASWCIKADDNDKKEDEKKNEHKSLQYKMRFKKKGSPTDSQISLEDCKFYFGNQGDGDKKELVFNNCSLEIVCFIPALMDFIDQHIATFFVLHNFGTRQTKGFGGFLLKDQSDEAIADVFKNSNQLYFYADMPIEDQTSVKNRMNHALTIYSVMKNGLNMTRYDENRRTYRFPNRYIKGFAMRPYLDKLAGESKIGSDKAFIKSRVLRSAGGDAIDAQDHDYDGHTFIRALLGLAENYEFRDRYRNNGSTSKIKNGKTVINYTPVGVTVINCPKNADGTPDINPSRSVEDIKKETKIQRFASPVLIKIYANRVYFLFDDSYKQMLGQTFLFLSFVKEGKKNRYESIRSALAKGHYLSTPDNFDMNNFVESFVSHYNDAVKQKLEYFEEQNSNIESLYANSRNLTLEKGW